MLVLIKNVEWNILRYNLRNRLRRRDHFDDVAFFGPIAGLDHFPINLNQPLIDQSLHPRPRKMRHPIDEILIDAAS